MTKTSLLDKFNTTFNNMIEDLVNTFPNDQEFPLYQFAAKSVIAADKTMMHTMFHRNVTEKYETMIMNRDEQFFLSKEFVKKESMYQQAEQLINKLKDCWNTLTDDNKDVLWKYFKVLVLLDKRIEESDNSI